MRYKYVVMTLLCCLCFSSQVKANDTALFVLQEESEQSELIFATLTSFFQQVEKVSLADLQPYQLEEATQVIVYGQSGTSQLLDEYDGPLVVIGGIAQNIKRLSTVVSDQTVSVRVIDGDVLEQVIDVQQVQMEGEVLLSGDSLQQSVPLIIRDTNTAFINMPVTTERTFFYFSKYLAQVLQKEVEDVHQAFIVLNNIHPLTDPEVVKQLAAQLMARNIPVYLQVTPTYIEVENERTVLLQDQKPLLEVLQQLQKNGAYVIGGGYTNYFHLDESQYGYEFWDAEMNGPIMVDEYEEGQYIQNRLVRSIQNLVENELYPVAFWAPQSMMSDTGYKVSTYQYNLHIGQLRQRALYFISTPSVLAGKTLLPLTLGSYSTNDVAFEERLQQLKAIQGAVISASYAVEDDEQNFLALLNEFDGIANKQWIDVNDFPVYTQTEKVTVTNEDGQVVAENSITLLDRAKQMLTERPVEFLLWCIMLVTTLFVTLFTIYIVNMRLRYRKRLFEERDEW